MLKRLSVAGVYVRWIQDTGSYVDSLQLNVANKLFSVFHGRNFQPPQNNIKDCTKTKANTATAVSILCCSVKHKECSTTKWYKQCNKWISLQFEFIAIWLIEGIQP